MHWFEIGVKNFPSDMKTTTRTNWFGKTGLTGCELVNKSDEEPYHYCLCDFQQCNDMYPIYNETTTSTTTVSPITTTKWWRTTTSTNSAISPVSIPLLYFSIVIVLVLE